jgi:hypothetical protein
MKPLPLKNLLVKLAVERLKTECVKTSKSLPVETGNLVTDELTGRKVVFYDPTKRASDDRCGTCGAYLFGKEKRCKCMGNNAKRKKHKEQCQTKVALYGGPELSAPKTTSTSVSKPLTSSD